MKKIKLLENRKFIITTIKSWNVKKSEELISKNQDYKILLITRPRALTYARIKKFDPEYIFFPHWSWKIPEEIYKKYECVVFHMTDLPFGRGGSPLQNLIARGIYRTKVTAIRVVKQLDAGAVYLKRDLALKGSASGIFNKSAKLIFEDMIPHIIKNKPDPIPQKGKSVKFIRRTPEQSNIGSLQTIRKVYDYIRMLDAEGYPLAFIETPSLRIEFSNAKLKGGHILTNAKISIREKK